MCKSLQNRGVLARGLGAVLWAMLAPGIALAGGWSATGSMAEVRAYHNSTLLPSGMVLVAGGQAGAVTVASAELYDPVTGTWSPTGAMAEAREMHSATLLGDGRVLVAGGVGVFGSPAPGTAELYDPATGLWAPTGPLNDPRSGHSATLLADGRVLAAGGFGPGGVGLLDSAEIYDPATNAWTLTGTMTVTRELHGAVRLGSGKVLVAGGTTAGGSTLADVWDPATGAWTPTASMVAGRFFRPTATLLASGKALVVGGDNLERRTEVYDPVTNAWSVSGTMYKPRNSHVAALLPTGEVVVAGGFNGLGGVFAGVELYDPVSESWSITGSMSHLRRFHAASFLPSGRLLVTGGFDDVETHASAELFDLALGGWGETGSMTLARTLHAAALLANGVVLVAGGQDPPGNLFDAAELYAPGTGEWASTGSMATPRSQHTLTRLASGEVLAVGGNLSAVLPAAERYDPATGTWTPTAGAMTTPRVSHSATLLPDGRVLVAGGFNSGAGGTLTSTELYDPATDSWSPGAPMLTARLRHTASLLPPGEVLVAAGGFLDVAEVYDPTTDSWSPTDSLDLGRESHRATELESGKVLVTGGRTPAVPGITVDEAEVYDPATGLWSPAGTMPTPHEEHTATRLASGLVLVAGGVTSEPTGTIGAEAELYDPAGGSWSATGPMRWTRVYHTATLLDTGQVLAAGGDDDGGGWHAAAEVYDPPRSVSATGGPDEATVGTVAATPPGATFIVPVFVRDLSSTPLGRDRPAGERIQGLVFKVVYTSPASVAAIAFSRAGITAPLTPLFETTAATADSVSYLASFAEGTDLVPFNLDAAAPGDQVAKLTVTLAAAAPPGTITLTLDPATTELSNQAGTLAENSGAGTLALAGGAVTVVSNAAGDLYAAPQSSSEILLTWSDPQQNETGFRLERSLDGASWAPAATLGPDDTALLDAGLTPATLYHYRLVTLIPAGDSHVSHATAAATFPSAAAKVCTTLLDADYTWARFPSPAFDGGGWGVAWQERTGGTAEQIFFQRLDQATGTPIGAPLQMTDTDSISNSATLRWNGSHYALFRYEAMRGEPGAESASNLFVSLFDAGGGIVRRDVRPFTDPLRAYLNTSRDLAVVWDGANWDLFTTDVFTEPFPDVVFARLSEDGDPVLGPVRLTSTPAYKLETAVAWSPTESKLGLVFISALDDTWEIYFQRVEEASGAAEPPVLLASYVSYFGFVGTSVAWTGSGWAVSWSETAADFSESRVWLQLLAPDGTPAGPPERVSDGPPELADDNVPSVQNRTGGGFTVITASADPSTGAYEIGRLQADAGGTRDGSLELLTPSDAANSFFPRVAGDGVEHLVAWNDDGQGTLEIADLLVDAGGSLPPGSPVDLTSGHSPGNGLFFAGSGPPRVATLGAGFVALWADATTSPATLHGRIFDGTGATVADLDPLSARGVRGTPGLVGVGDSFAAGWKDGNTVVFQRFDAAGNPLTGEVELSTTAGGRPEVALGFDGEAYGALWSEAGAMTFRRVAPDGTPLGPAVSGLAGFAPPGPQMQWVRTGWAVLFRQGPDLYYGLLDRDGGVVVPATLVAASSLLAVPINQYSLLYNGQQLAVAWSAILGVLDPPGREILFTVLDLDGTKLFPEVVVVSHLLDDGQPSLSWDPSAGTFHLVHFHGSGALREIQIAPDGTVLPGERFLANRGGVVATASNGTTLGLAWSQLNRLYFETTACLDDPSPPPCPDLSATSANGDVQLSWDGVADPESGIWRYDLYRDGTMLAENFPTTTAFADRGFVVGATHVYELRAMNGAFRESAGCPALAFSTVAGDANGDGNLEVADIFYLINFLLADGSPPAGDADANGDGAVTVTDVFYLINYFFAGGPAPVWRGAVEVLARGSSPPVPAGVEANATGGAR